MKRNKYRGNDKINSYFLRKRIFHVALALRHFEKNSFFLGGGGGGRGACSGAFTLPCLITFWSVNFFASKRNLRHTDLDE